MADRVTFDSALQPLGDIASESTATASFQITADATITGHCYVPAELRITADNGYDRTRHFIFEIGRLPLNTPIQGGLQTDKFDEYHAWHVDLAAVPPGTTGIRFRTNAPTDIDLLVKHGAPPQYDIQLLFVPEPGLPQLFFTDADLVGGSGGGNEDVTFQNPQAGTYHVVVVNFSQEVQNYSLRADLVNPGVVAYDPSAFSVNESAGTATITVKRTVGATGAASVNYSANGGTAVAGCDYTAVSGTLSWANDDMAPRTFTVPIASDAFDENDEVINLTLSNASGTSLGTPSIATLTITDDDTGGSGGGDTLSLFTSGFNVSEAQATVTISVNRSCGGTGAAPASVEFLAANGTALAGSDYLAANGTLSWNTGETTIKTFAVSIINDSDDESNETLNLSLGNASGATLGTPSAAVLTIVDDDTPPPTSGGGGGGSGSAASLLLLSVVVALRRWRNKKI